jgi:succinyl-CoA synthetase alpha subunit
MEVDAVDVQVLRTLADLGFEFAEQRFDRAVQASLELDFDGRFLRRHDVRGHATTGASLHALLTARSVAVVGVRRDGTGVAADVVRNLRAAGFAGDVVAVGRDRFELAGVPVVPEHEGLQVPVDVAVVCVPASGVERAVAAVLAAGTKTICVVSAGFAETGATGAGLQTSLTELVHRHGARLLGPNCLGFARPPIGLDATFAAHPFPSGHLGCAAQSGAVLLALREQAARRGFGFSSVASLGNGADVTATDLLELWEDDRDTGAAILYLESLGDARRVASPGSPSGWGVAPQSSCCAAAAPAPACRRPARTPRRSPRTPPSSTRCWPTPGRSRSTTSPRSRTLPRCSTTRRCRRAGAWRS